MTKQYLDKIDCFLNKQQKLKLQLFEIMKHY